MFSASFQYIFLYNILLIIVILTVIGSTTTNRDYLQDKLLNRSLALCLLIFMIVIIAWREWDSKLFADSGEYGRSIIAASKNSTEKLWSDWGFNLLVKVWGKMGFSPESFFYLTGFVYCFPMFVISYKLTPNFSFIVLLFFATSMSFYGYGVNGIRNGMAASLILLAMLYKERKLIMLLLFSIGLSFHNSMILPISAVLVTLYYKKTATYLSFWVIAIIVSLITGRYFQDLFLEINFISKLGGDYLTNGGSEFDPSRFSRIGFRWDFLSYSAIPVGLGYYITQKKKLQMIIIYSF